MANNLDKPYVCRPCGRRFKAFSGPGSLMEHRENCKKALNEVLKRTGKFTHHQSLERKNRSINSY